MSIRVHEVLRLIQRRAMFGWHKDNRRRTAETARGRATMLLSKTLARHVTALMVVLAAVLAPADASAGTLERIQDRGLLQCGVNVAGMGLVEVDAQGRWVGFFPDMCRALAAAILGDAEAVDFVEVDFVTRFDALRGGAFDVLMSNTTWTMRRDVQLGLAFTATLLYDGQGFLAHNRLGIERLDDLDGPATVCVHSNTTTIDNLQDLVQTRYPNLEIRAYESNEAGFDAFFAHSCNMFTTDRSSLIGLRASRASNPDDYVLLQDVISREPVGPVVREDDMAWLDLVQWVMFALIVAEENGLTSANVDAALGSEVPEIARLLGLEGDFGESMGVPRDWAFQAIHQVGSYGEIYDRHFGPDTQLAVPRGINDLWTRGGLIYAPPVR